MTSPTRLEIVRHGCSLCGKYQRRGWHLVYYDDRDRVEVVQWVKERAGEQDTNWAWPRAGIMAIRDPEVAMLFKLTWPVGEEPIEEY